HTYSLVSGTGSADNASFNISGNQLRTSASFNYEVKSSYTIRVQTNDGECTYEKQFTITVNDVIEIASFTINAIANTSVNENAAYTSVTPALSGDTPIGNVTWSKGGTDQSLFTINTSTGVVQMVARNYESPADANADNVYEISVTATDEDGNYDSEDWTVTVNNVSEPATFTINAIADVSLAENLPYTSVTPAITGTPNGSITYSKEGADEADFTINPTTGVIQMVARDYEAPVDANTDNVYEVTLRVTDDDGNTDTEGWTVTITDVSETATFSINTIPNSSVNENATYTSPTPSISGSPSGSVTYTIEGADAARFSVNGTSGVVTLSPKDYEVPVDANTDNVYEVTLRATDGDANSATTSWTVTVNDVVETASFTINAISNVSHPENSTYNSVTPALSGDTPIGNVTWSIEGADAGQFSVNTSTGTVTLSPKDYEAPADANTDNVYEITLRATDDDGNTDTEYWTVTITDVADGKPEIVCVMDLSYSMNRDFDDNNTSDPDAVKLKLAKSALNSFLDLLTEFNYNNAMVGLSRFPNSPQMGCDAGSIELLQNFTSTYNTSLQTTVTLLVADGNSTPLLEGITFASGMFSSSVTNKVIALLSDGRHNCSTFSNADLTTLSTDLTNNGIKLYTLGFGNNSIVPNDVLNALATPTGGVHYNIASTSGKSGPAFNPASPAAWAPANSLKAAYANIIISGLGLSSSADPYGIIDQGKEEHVYVPITKYDKTVCFFVSWETFQNNNLNLRLYKPDGSELSLREAGVSVIHKESYSIITLHENLLVQKGMRGVWQLVIDAANSVNDREYYQYTIINESRDIELNTWFDKEKYYTGDNMKIYMELLLENNRQKPLSKTFIYGTRPEEGLGNWLSSREVTIEQLRNAQALVLNKQIRLKPPATHRSMAKWDSLTQHNVIALQKSFMVQNADPIQLKALVLMNEYKMQLPRQVKIEGLKFNDEGREGDEKAGDGIYTASITSLPKAGSYEFYMSVNDTSKGVQIQREGHLQTWVNVKINVEKFIGKVEKYMAAPDGRTMYMITLSLQDVNGNIPSPEALRTIELMAKGGELAGGIISNPDGTYTQKILLDKDTKLSKVSLSIKADGQEGSQKLAQSPVPWKIIIIILIILLLIILGLLKKKK
ncbi:MAG: VWA domain-containing protein, partial [Bacteroidales bacterium]|nr:VWA domain-containing protein [Bacteroidales bacterium]